MCQDVDLFIGECFRIICEHRHNADVANFAFPFASAFLQCTAFQDRCMKYAMPLFEHCVEDPLLANRARLVLVEAFAPTLEKDIASQQKLLELLKLTESPALYVIVAAFRHNSLPFPAVSKSCDDIMEMTLNAEQLSQAILLLTVMLKRASQPLSDSILWVVTTLVTKHEKDINHVSLVPMYSFALSRLAMFPSAVDFVRVIAGIDPSIASHKQDFPAAQKTIEDVSKQLAEIVKNQTERVPITTCEELTDLMGLIDQKNPPKIDPFGALYEMFVALRDGTPVVKPLLSTLGSVLRSGMFGNRAYAMASSMHDLSQASWRLKPLVVLPLLDAALEVPQCRQEFVVSPAEFASLDEDSDEN
jgi:hypothetical protein